MVLVAMGHKHTKPGLARQQRRMCVGRRIGWSVDCSRATKAASNVCWFGERERERERAGGTKWGQGGRAAAKFPWTSPEFRRLAGTQKLCDFPTQQRLLVHTANHKPLGVTGVKAGGRPRNSRGRHRNFVVSPTHRSVGTSPRSKGFWPTPPTTSHWD